MCLDSMCLNCAMQQMICLGRRTCLSLYCFRKCFVKMNRGLKMCSNCSCLCRGVVQLEGWLGRLRGITGHFLVLVRQNRCQELRVVFSFFLIRKVF